MWVRAVIMYPAGIESSVEISTTQSTASEASVDTSITTAPYTYTGGRIDGRCCKSWSVCERWTIAQEMGPGRYRWGLGGCRTSYSSHFTLGFSLPIHTMLLQIHVRVRLVDAIVMYVTRNLSSAWPTNIIIIKYTFSGRLSCVEVSARVMEYPWNLWYRLR